MKNIKKSMAIIMTTLMCVLPTTETAVSAEVITNKEIGNMSTRNITLHIINNENVTVDSIPVTLSNDNSTDDTSHQEEDVEASSESNIIAFKSTMQEMHEEMILEDEKRIREEEERYEAMARRTSFAPEEVISPYEGYFTGYMDLSSRMDITTDDMDYIIDTFLAGRVSALSGLGQAFIDASKLTGYDPIFLLALTANEGGWIVSDLHYSKSNPYSINMVDSDPSAGYNMGSSYYEGIVEGALWIHENYYDIGSTTLYDMIYGIKCYASARDKWINDIASTMAKAYTLIY